MKALLLENIHPVAHADLRAAGFEVEATAGALAPAELAHRLAGVSVLGIRSKTHIDAAVFDHAPDLLAVGAFCIGVNQIDIAHANRRGVPVFNAPFSNTRSVAELVIGEIVALSRQLGDLSAGMHAGRWRKSARGSHEVRGKSLGIVGYGHIGRQVGVLAESMGLRVSFHDIVQKLPMGNNHPAATLDEVLATSDFVTLHVPDTKETRGLIDRAAMAKMKPGAYLLNLSRGGVVDIDALADALAGGHLAGAAIDVFPEEPNDNQQPFVSRLRGLPNVILTPHVGGSTEEAQEAIGHEVASTVAKFIDTGATSLAVNFPHVDPPPRKQRYRITNVHANVPGVLSEINRLMSDVSANVESQVLATDPQIGYLVMDLDRNVSAEVSARISRLSTSIRTRVVGAP